MKGTQLSLIGSFFFALTAQANIEWEKLSPYPTIGDLTSIAQGNGAIVAAGTYLTTVRTPTIIYSFDSGAEWSEVPGLMGGAINGLAFGNGSFVAVGSDGLARVSTNGANWSSYTAAATPLSSIVFGNGLFVVGANDGSILTSTNGTSWNVITGVGATNLHLAAFGDERFFLKESGKGNRFAVVSTNGIDWSRITMQGVPVTTTGYFGGGTDPFEIRGLAIGNGRLAMVVTYGYFAGGIIKYFTSLDAVNWVEAGTPAAVDSAANALHFKAGQFVQVWGRSGSGAEIATSPDLANWSKYPLPSQSGPLNAIEFDGFAYVAVGVEGIVYSGPTLSSLERRDNTEKRFDFVSVATKGETVVGVSNIRHGSNEGFGNPGILVSTNEGRTFSRAALPRTVRGFSAVRQRNGQFLAVGAQGLTLRSTDGLTWTETPAVTDKTLMDLDFIDGRWIAVGDGGTVLTSTNATEFTPRNSGTSIPLYGVAGTNGMVVAVGASGAFLRSTDLQSWSLSGTDEGTDLWSIAFGNGRFVAVGNNGRVYISTNGTDWSSKRIIGATTLGRVVFAHGLFLTTELFFDNPYISADGTNWTQLKVPGLSALGADVSEGKFLVCGLSTSYSQSTSYGTVIFREKLGMELNARIASDRFELNWETEGTANYSIYSAGDIFATSWDRVGTVNGATGFTQWKDTNSLSGRRFYRVQKD